MDEAREPTEGDERLVRILADCLERQDRGEAVDVDQLIKKYPDLTEEIRAFFQSADWMDHLARSQDIALKPPAAATDSAALSAADESTFPSEFDEAASEQPDATTREIPARIGRYLVLRPLGRGGMGTVYLVHDPKLTRDVALKLPRFGKIDANEGRARFYVEARAAARLRHANICRILDFGEIGDVPYYTMEFIDGINLADTIGDRGLENFAEAAGIVSAVADAMHEAHENGVIHRDLKPSNIIIDAKHQPVIVDFGLAREIVTHTELQLTKPDSVLGTAGYAAPEQLSGDRQRIGPAADIWSLGVVLYELLTGQLPFQGTTVADIVAKILRDEVPRPSDVRSGIPAELEAICLKMLAKPPENRIASMNEVSCALSSLEQAREMSDGDTPVAFFKTTVRTERPSEPPAGPPDAGQQPSTETRLSASRFVAIAVLLAVGLGISWAATKAYVARGERDAAGDLEPALNESDLERKLVGHAGGVSAMAFSPGQRLLSVVTPSSIKTWDFAIGNLARSFDVDDFTKVESIDYSADGSRIALGARGRVTVIDSVSGKTIFSVERKDAVTGPARFTPDGKLLAAASDKTTVSLWNTDTGAVVRTLAVPSALRRTLAIHPDGTVLATGAKEAAVALFDITTGQPIRKLDTAPRRITNILYDPRGSVLAIAGGDPNVGFFVRLYDPATGQLRQELRGHTDNIDGLAFSPCGSVLATGSDDNTVRLWNVRQGTQLAMRRESHAIGAIAFDHTGRRLAFAAGETVGLLSLPSFVPPDEAEPGLQATLIDHLARVDTVAFGPNNRFLYSAGGPSYGQEAHVTDSDVRVWDLSTFKMSRRLPCSLRSIHKLHVSSDGQELAAMSDDRKFQFWNLETGEPVKSFNGVDFGSIGTGRIDDFDYLPRGRRLILVGSDGHTVVETHNPDHPLQHWPGKDGRLLRVAVFPKTGEILSGAQATGVFRMWNVPLQAEMASFVAPEGIVDTLAVSADGRRAVSGSYRTFTVWDVQTRHRMQTWLHSEAGANLAQDVAAISPDGRQVLLASNSKAGHVGILLDALNGKQLGTLQGHTDSITAVAISSDGRLAATSSVDKTIKLWRLGEPPDIDRMAADWVLGVGGQVAVEGREGLTSDPAELPDRDFRCTAVNLEGRTGIQDDEYRHLAGLERLVELRLKNTPVSATALRAFGSLPSLTILVLTESRLHATALHGLAPQPELRHLSLGGTQVRDLQPLTPVSFPALQVLTLGRTQITDEELGALSTLPRLRELYVTETAISDAAVEHIGRIQSLEVLYYSQGTFSDDALQKLSAQRPTLKLVEFD